METRRWKPVRGHVGLCRRSVAALIAALARAKDPSSDRGPVLSEHGLRRSEFRTATSLCATRDSPHTSAHQCHKPCLDTLYRRYLSRAGARAIACAPSRLRHWVQHSLSYLAQPIKASTFGEAVVVHLQPHRRSLRSRTTPTYHQAAHERVLCSLYLCRLRGPERLSRA